MLRSGNLAACAYTEFAVKRFRESTLRGIDLLFQPGIVSHVDRDTGPVELTAALGDTCGKAID